jgi:putative tryptophan/tyrosine transport system substrate-binding protein
VGEVRRAGGNDDQLTRRDLIAILGGAVTAWPHTSYGQQGTMLVIGVLGTYSRASDETTGYLPALRRSLSDEGLVDGRNFVFEYRYGEGRDERLAALAVELVAKAVALIVCTGGTQSAVAAKHATTTIPILFRVGGDPVKLGLVQNLNQPGGNATGMTTLAVEILAKQLEVLHELLPKAPALAVFLVPNEPSGTELEISAQKASQALGIPIHIANPMTTAISMPLSQH